MDWQQKAEALASLGELSIKFRERENRIGGPDPWYVSQRIEIKDGPCLLGSYGNGYTPQEALEDHWETLTTRLKPDQYLVIRGLSDDRKAVRWNGFMWADVHEPKRDAA